LLYGAPCKIRKKEIEGYLPLSVSHTCDETRIGDRKSPKKGEWRGGEGKGTQKKKGGHCKQEGNLDKRVLYYAEKKKAKKGTWLKKNWRPSERGGFFTRMRKKEKRCVGIEGFPVRRERGQVGKRVGTAWRVTDRCREKWGGGRRVRTGRDGQKKCVRKISRRTGRPTTVCWESRERTATGRGRRMRVDDREGVQPQGERRIYKGRASLLMG